jgi:hypothetical protein
MLTNTQLLERYLQAIEFWLPKDGRRDILAEISEDLNSRIEEQEQTLGRVLTEAEFEALLKERGRPMLVANRYRPQQQSLIGPTWFPSYIAVMKKAGIWYVPAWVTAYVVVQRLQHPADAWATTFMAAWTIGWTVAFWAVSVITLVFAVVQFTDSRTHFMENWNPRELPAVRDPDKIVRANSIAEVLVGVVFVLWWVSEASTLAIFNGPAFRLVFTSAWFYFFWGYLAIGLFNIGLSIANFLRPHWTGLRAALRMASDLAAGVLFCWLLKAHIVADLAIANASPARTMEIRGVIELLMERCLPFAVIVVVVVASVDLFRVVRVSRGPSEQLSRGVVA